MAFFASQWTPKRPASAGLNADKDIIIKALVGINFLFGDTRDSLIFGALTTRVHAYRLLIPACVTAAVMLVAFTLSASTPSLMFASALWPTYFPTTESQASKP